ncbi:MAG: lipoprotein [Frankiales bacterium]|nr:lipoprotein [Frankiales bacterium]
MKFARGPRFVALLAALLLAAPLGGQAYAHEEREAFEPAPAAHPDYRDSGPSLVVCKPDAAQRLATLPAPVRKRNLGLLARGCDFQHLQAAVDSVEKNGPRGTRILVLPGVYREEPSLRMNKEFGGAPVGREDLGPQCKAIAPVSEDTGADVPALTYEQQRLCPHKDNLVAVLGDVTPTDANLRCDSNLCGLQIEGTGASPRDVVVDGDFKILNGLKGDRADGLYLKRLMAQQFEFNAVYVLETAGATFDEVDASFNHEYGFLSFLSFVRYENCSGQANGDSTVYPGASPNINKDAGLIPVHRDEMTFSTEVRGCRSHHNGLGYSGTTGNSIWAHHNEFDHNSTGLATDSLFAGHPGTPQNHALWEKNLFHSNNENYYSRYAVTGQCALPIPERDYGDGAVCPATPQPVGTGLLVAGGNFNWATQNSFYDNWRQGTFQFSIPAEVREETVVPEAHFRPNCGPDGDQMCPFEENSHWNTYSGNRLAENPANGLVQPNGYDFAWDVEGEGNCWDSTDADANTKPEAAGAITYGSFQQTELPKVSLPFPSCEQRDTYVPAGNVLVNASCITYNAETDPHPTGCPFMDDPAPPATRQPEGPVLQRVAGTDRIGTAVAASKEGFPGAARAVTLARADLYPDALAGAPLASRRGGPLLLTGSGGLDPRVAAEIRRLRATQVVLLGGTTALSPTVVSDLRGLGIAADEITRVAGTDRYATAAAIGRQMPSTNAFLVKGNAPDGQGWVDAVSVSPVAALLGRPILLTAPEALSSATSAALRTGGYDAVDIVGGTTAVASSVATATAGIVPDVERIAGADRFATSLEMAKWAVLAGADPSELWLTTARDWPDAVAAGSAIAVDEGILLLADDTVEASAVQTWLDEVNPVSASASASVSDVLERVRVLGGTGAVPAKVEQELVAAYAAAPGDARGDRSSGATLWHGRTRSSAVAGTATVERTVLGSTRAWLQLSGLRAGAAYAGRLSTGTCAAPAGDYDLPGSTELALPFTADEAGNAVADDTVFEVAAAGPSSLVVRSAAGDRVACVDLRG